MPRCDRVRPVGAIADDRGVGVGDREDASLEGNLLADQAARVAAAVGTLAVAEDPLTDVLQADIAEQRGRQLWLALDLGPLLLRERTALTENRGRDLLAPHAAHQRREANSVDLRLAEPSSRAVSSAKCTTSRRGLGR